MTRSAEEQLYPPGAAFFSRLRRLKAQRDGVPSYGLFGRLLALVLHRGRHDGLGNGRDAASARLYGRR